MKDSLEIFVQAIKETPRLYFLPLAAMFRAIGDVQRQMVEIQRKR